MDEQDEHSALATLSRKLSQERRRSEAIRAAAGRAGGLLLGYTMSLKADDEHAQRLHELAIRMIEDVERAARE